MAQQFLSRRGDHQPPPVPLKQQTAIVLLQFLHRLGDGGLGEIELLGGSVHGAAVHHRRKDPQMPDGHALPSCSSRSRRAMRFSQSSVSGANSSGRVAPVVRAMNPHSAARAAASSVRLSPI